MTGTARTKYQTGVALYNQRKHLEENIDAGDYFPNLDFYDYLSPIQQMIFFFLLKGFTKEWIEKHLEYDSRQAFSYQMGMIRVRLARYLKDMNYEI